MIYTDITKIVDHNNEYNIDFESKERIYFYTDNEDKYRIALQKINEYNLKKIKYVYTAKLERDGSIDPKTIYLWEINSIKGKYEKEILNSFIERYKNDDVDKLVETINALKTKIGKNMTIEKLEGHMGEAFFIRECIKMGYKDAIKEAANYFSELEQGTIDYVINGQKFEIKTTSNSKSEINITNTQILENPNIVVVKFNPVEDNKTILDLYEEIRILLGDELPNLLKQRWDHYEENKDLISKITYNDETKVKFFFYDNSFLPNSNWLQSLEEHIKKVTFTMDLKIDSSAKFEEKIKQLLNK